MIGKLKSGIELTLCEVLFGLPTYNNPNHKPIINGKWYSNYCKTQYLFDWISLIKEKTEILKNINTINNEEVETWLTDLGSCLDNHISI